MFKFKSITRQRKVDFIVADDDREINPSKEGRYATLHSALCQLAQFAENDYAANVVNIETIRTKNGNIYRGEVDYVDEHGKRVHYLLNVGFTATFDTSGMIEMGGD